MTAPHTVASLIEALKNYPPDVLVMVEDDGVTRPLTGTPPLVTRQFYPPPRGMFYVGQSEDGKEIMEERELPPLRAVIL